MIRLYACALCCSSSTHIAATRRSRELCAIIYKKAIGELKESIGTGKTAYFGSSSTINTYSHTKKYRPLGCIDSTHQHLHHLLPKSRDSSCHPIEGLTPLTHLTTLTLLNRLYYVDTALLLEHPFRGGFSEKRLLQVTHSPNRWSGLPEVLCSVFRNTTPTFCIDGR